MTLAETQTLFFGVVTGSDDAGADALERWFRGGAGALAADRLAVYRGMYVARLVDALRETFPNLARFLGDERFQALGEDYVDRHPSDHHDVGRIGRLLPAFLRRHPAPGRPDLADLAELEWARNEAFFAPATTSVRADGLRTVPQEELAGARLGLAPSLRLLVLAHDAPALWRRLERRQPPEAPAAGTLPVAVWRNGFEVLHRTLDACEGEALRLAREGRTLSEICACFEGRADPVADAFAALSSWLAEGWVARMGRTTR